MSGSPEEKAGNAGALEETLYGFGGTLGVAILGIVSALICHHALADAPVSAAMDPAVAEQA
ncbi:MAG: hypothetical protein QM621_11305 [Aeromicrobium sp.]|uniref:hypothetical protein n=1 Tax=Aeromicrobium sp. TaxID=1871063 RepID=UPI0039E269CC